MRTANLAEVVATPPIKKSTVVFPGIIAFPEEMENGEFAVVTHPVHPPDTFNVLNVPFPEESILVVPFVKSEPLTKLNESPVPTSILSAAPLNN